MICGWPMINISALHLAKIATQRGLYPQVERSSRMEVTQKVALVNASEMLVSIKYRVFYYIKNMHVVGMPSPNKILKTQG